MESYISEGFLHSSAWCIVNECMGLGKKQIAVGFMQRPLWTAVPQFLWISYCYSSSFGGINQHEFCLFRKSWRKKKSWSIDDITLNFENIKSTLKILRPLDFISCHNVEKMHALQLKLICNLHARLLVVSKVKSVILRLYVTFYMIFFLIVKIRGILFKTLCSNEIVLYIRICRWVYSFFSCFEHLCLFIPLL